MVAPTEEARLPLSNLRVIDFGWVMAGPQATRIMADFGAEVIKVESRARPDSARTNSRPFFGDKPGINRSGYFNNFNRNKRSINLNLTKVEARPILTKLIRIADVVLDNFSPGVLARWGFSYEEMRKIQPAITCISMSGFGSGGPYGSYRTYGPIAQAVSGLTQISGVPGRPPSGWGFSYMDHNAGYLGAIAVLSAFYNSLESGQGQAIELPQVDGSIALTGTAILNYQLNGTASAPFGNDHPYPATQFQGLFRCKGEDRWLAITVRTETEFEAFCEAIDQPDLGQDPRFKTLAARKQHREELDRIVEQWTVERDPQEAMVILQEAGIAAGAVQNPEDVWDKDPQIQHLGLKVPIYHPEGGDIPVEGMPVQFSDMKPRFWRHGPLLGQDNEYVFCDLLGLDPEEVERLVKMEVIY